MPLLRTIILLGIVAGSPARAADRPLLVLDGQSIPPAVTVTNAKLAVASIQSDRALTIKPMPGGGNGSIALAAPAPTGAWDLSAFDSVLVELRNSGAAPVVVHARAENPDADGYKDSSRSARMLESGERAALRVRLVRRPVDPGFEPFRPFYMYATAINVREGTVDPSKIARIVMSIDDFRADQSVDIVSIRAIGERSSIQPPFFPFCDAYGQYIHGDWPGKIERDEDFAQRRAEEAKETSAWPGPGEWDRYGGWSAGPTLEKTGHFHATQRDGKWWLVDPDGKLFWSYGATGVGLGGDRTPITDRANWFADLPAKDSPLARFFGHGSGALYKYYQSRDYDTFDFSGANLLRKYGSDYANVVGDLMHQRLRSWGFNTIANWSSSEIYLKRRTPYVVAIHYDSPKLNHIPDAFDPQFQPALRRRMEREIGTTAGDPWCIGYFVDNELWWGADDDARAVTAGAMKRPADCAAKGEFVADLQKRYETIDALNQSWGTNYASWDALREDRQGPDAKRKEVAADFGAFGLKFAEKYFSTVRAEVKRAAPDNLYLGCRFHGHISTSVVKVAEKYCDVIAWNVYDRVPGQRLDRYVGVIDKPFIVGEFGVESDPEQTPFRGKKDAGAAPGKRGSDLTTYVSAAFVHPLLVGAHFFQLRDQALTGRPDGEAVLRGFINGADTPHLDLIEANRHAAYDLYRKRAGGGGS